MSDSNKKLEMYAADLIERFAAPFDAQLRLLEDLLDKMADENCHLQAENRQLQLRWENVLRANRRLLGTVKAEREHSHKLYLALHELTELMKEYCPETYSRAEKQL